MGKRSVVGLLVAIALCAGPVPAVALLDIPTSEHTAREVAELAGSSGVARPAGLAMGPLDDLRYLEAYRALQSRGLVDPYGARLSLWNERPSDGPLYLESLRPLPRLRLYWAGDEVRRRILYHTSGDVLRNGFNGFLALRGAAFWERKAGGYYELQIRRRPGDFSVRVKRLYVKWVWGKWSLKVGRDAERLGPGYHGSLLLSDNAPTYDYWRIRTEEPLFLPGRLEWLGGFRFSLFNAYLSDGDPDPPDPRYGSPDRSVDDPRLLGMRVSYHPTSWLDLGLSRTILYGGKGRETYDTPRDWWELFTARNENVKPGESRRYDNDQYVALDFTLRLPFLNGVGPLKGGKIYWEYGATDIISRWQGESTGNWEPFQLNRVANLGGIYLTTAVTDFRFEYAQTDTPWYRHTIYGQGYSYRGYPLGHHMGGDARNWFVEISRYFGPAWRATLSADVEERGRSSPTEERRAEWTFTLEARDLRAFGIRFRGQIQALWAKVDNPWDDPERDDRTETFLGLSLDFAY